MPILTVELIPKTAWKQNVRSLLTQAEWDIVRREVYQRAGYICEICGASGVEVHAHEQWHFDDETHRQTLVRMVCLCKTCHQVKHFYSSVNSMVSLVTTVRKRQDLIDHACKVNGWDHGQFLNHLHAELVTFVERSRYNWELHVFALEDYMPDSGKYNVEGFAV